MDRSKYWHRVGLLNQYVELVYSNLIPRRHGL
jgi:hypothetical protein